jgi:hypothetical protein
VVLRAHSPAGIDSAYLKRLAKDTLVIVPTE